jgi:myo-inositol 2-dehydrogenase/D-chiro-inositol 1-dehydrogenase
MPPNLQTLSPRDSPLLVEHAAGDFATNKIIRCAILGCGMMGQEHVSYLMGYPSQTRLDFLCDPHEPSLTKCLQVMKEFRNCRKEVVTPTGKSHYDDLHAPQLFHDEQELYKHANEIDLLIIASPNYLHTPQLLKWSTLEHLTILCEKPVAVSHEQLLQLQAMNPKAKIWIAMEYRFIPAINKLLSLLPTVGDIQMVTIRENRYPFLHKIDKWNRDRTKTGKLPNNI